MTTRVDVYVDYVCPYCYLVEGALEELKRDRDVDVRIRAFELRPDPVPTLRPEDEYLPKVWNSSVYPLARRLGVHVSLPTISPQPRTGKAFLVLQLAQEYGVAEAYSTGVYQAFFRDDRNIGDEEVIVDVAGAVGLDANEVRAALRSDHRGRRHRAELDHAVDSVGITSVPGIVIDGRVLPGVPSAALLKSTVDQSVVQSSPATPVRQQ